LHISLIVIMNGHHLVLGNLVDFITGETIQDTHDEQYRQKLARLLVNKKGYYKEEITPRSKLYVKAGDKKAVVKIDLVVTLCSKVCMIVKYGPGSIVTRQRPSLAASRLIVSYQVPFVVVTNGEDARILEGASGKVFSEGLLSMPSKHDLTEITDGTFFDPVSSRQAKMESRILYTFEVEGTCPCDDAIERL
jgi:hypothetical protein